MINDTVLDGSLVLQTLDNRARCRAFDWGTVLQVGRSRVWFPIV